MAQTATPTPANPDSTTSGVQAFQDNHKGDVSVTVADTEHNRENNDEKKMMQFNAGPKFQAALDAALFSLNKARETNQQPKLSMAAFLRETVAHSINFDPATDPVQTRQKYATEAERKAAIKANQQRAAAERKKLNKLIQLAKQKQGKKDAIAALMASLNISDDDLADD